MHYYITIGGLNQQVSYSTYKHQYVLNAIYSCYQEHKGELPSANEVLTYIQYQKLLDYKPVFISLEYISTLLFRIRYGLENICFCELK